MADHARKEKLKRPRKPRKPKPSATQGAVENYRRALEEWRLRLAVYKPAYAARRAASLSESNRRRGKRPAASNVARAARRRESLPQKLLHRRAERARRALALIKSTVLSAGQHADWPTRLLAAHEAVAEAGGRALEPGQEVSLAMRACEDAGAPVQLLCARELETLAGSDAPGE